MLLHFGVHNFSCFFGESEDLPEDGVLDLVATRERKYKDTLADIGGSRHIRVTPTAAVFGANASGKSSLINALAALRSIVITTRERNEGFILPTHRGHGSPMPTTFAVRCAVPDPQGNASELIVDYTLTVDQSHVLSETLSLEQTKDTKVLFERNGNDVEYYSDLSASSTADSVGRLLRSNELVLAELAAVVPPELFTPTGRYRTSDEDFETFSKEVLDDAALFAVPAALFRWFAHQLTVIPSESRYMHLPFRVEVDRAFRSALGRYLPAVDSGIIDIRLKEINWMPDGVEPLIEEAKRTGNASVLFPDISSHDAYVVTAQDGIPQVSQLVTVHKNDDGSTFDVRMGDESDGTNRFLDLLPAVLEESLEVLPQVYVIDEIDRSLHPNLTVMLVETFLQGRSPESRSQLIFTTHEDQLLRSQILRRDEIWLLEKYAPGRSRTTRLTDFPPQVVRDRADLASMYLSGRLGGVPQTSPMLTSLPPRSPSSNDM